MTGAPAALVLARVPDDPAALIADPLVDDALSA